MSGRATCAVPAVLTAKCELTATPFRLCGCSLSLFVYTPPGLADIHPSAWETNLVHDNACATDEPLHVFYRARRPQVTVFCLQPLLNSWTAAAEPVLWRRENHRGSVPSSNLLIKSLRKAMHARHGGRLPAGFVLARPLCPHLFLLTALQDPLRLRPHNRHGIPGFIQSFYLLRNTFRYVVHAALVQCSARTGDTIRHYLGVCRLVVQKRFPGP